MRRSSLVLALVLALAALAVLRWRGSSGKEQAPHSHASGPEVSPVCPWREPRRNLLALFPPATNYVTESRILSRMTVEVEQRLGRHLTADENPLRLHRVRHENQWPGSVLVTRVKGGHGGIEIVTGVETNGAVRGVLIQSQREPDAVARVITGSNFLAAFAGKDCTSPLRLGEDLPDVSAEARASAQAVADGVRSLLVVLSFAELPLEVREFGTSTNR